jgi:hypothetical protein
VVVFGSLGNKQSHPHPPSKTNKQTKNSGVARLFTEWNEKLVNGTPRDVANMYWAKGSVLLATLEDEPLVTPEQKEKYFVDFQSKKPTGAIDERLIELGCNTATDAGVYTFTLRNTEPPTKVKARYTCVDVFFFFFFVSFLSVFFMLQRPRLPPLISHSFLSFLSFPLSENGQPTNSYTYTFDPKVKQWKISTHHSSKLPSAASKPAAAPAPAPEPASS